MDPTQTAQTVPMLAPDGTSGDIPQERVQDALKAGFKQAVEMTSPDGKTGYIPVERQQDALGAGFKLTPPPAPLDPRNSIQKSFDANTQTSPGEPLLETGLKSVVHAIGQPFVHPVQTAQGVAQNAPNVIDPTGVLAHALGTPTPIDAAKGVTAPVGQDYSAAGGGVKGAAYAGTKLAGDTFGNVALGTAAGAAPDAFGGAKTTLGQFAPSAQMRTAGGLLQSVAQDANKVPVQLNNAGDAALNLMDWQRKTQLGPTINKFLNRVTNPKMGPLTYEEARDYYQLLGKLSSDETSKLAPPVRRDLVQMVTGLKQDIGDAADQVGRAADYYQGMQDYSTAAKHQEFYDTAKEWAKKVAINSALTGAGVGGLATLWHALADKK